MNKVTAQSKSNAQVKEIKSHNQTSALTKDNQKTSFSPIKAGFGADTFWLFFLLLLGTVTVSGAGLFYTTGAETFAVTNVYGDSIRIYGNGIYKNDSFFRAPIFRGTDFTVLFVVCPLLLVALLQHKKQKSTTTQLQVISLTGVVTYYAVSVAFGIMYNNLHLLYTFLFSLSVFCLIAGLQQLDAVAIANCVKMPLPHKGIAVFLAFTGMALLGAWLPDILGSFSAGRAPLLIEHYTTEITYVLDMGLISPACFLCLYLLKKKNGWGYVLLDLLLTLCLVMGVMLPMQTLFQWQAGIVVPLAILLTKMISFCLLAVFAGYFKLRLWKSMRPKKSVSDPIESHNKS